MSVLICKHKCNNLDPRGGIKIMRTQTKKLTKGFTIIEVLIVLAIAGLILAIIFLAVPALQRNSRNTALRGDAANTLAGVNEFIANNNGQMPTSAACAAPCTSGDVSITGAAGTNNASAKVRGGTTVTSSAVVSGTQTIPATSADTGKVTVYFNARCTPGATNTVTYNPRSVAAGYAVETSGNPVAQCQEG